MRGIALTIKTNNFKEHYRVYKIPIVRKFLIKTYKTESTYALDAGNDIIHFVSGHRISDDIIPELARFIVQYFSRARNQE